MTIRKQTDFIVIHCSATRESQMDSVKMADIRQWHLARGWSDIGYHFVIESDGNIAIGRQPINSVGAHVRGHNWHSLGICLVGGLDDAGRAVANFRPEQMKSLESVIKYLRNSYPDAKIVGHRDLSPDLDGDGVIEKHEWVKDCPCFDAALWWERVND